MIICICRNLNEKKINDAIDAGAGTPRQVLGFHGEKANCAQCSCEIRQMIRERNAAAEPLQTGLAAQ